MSEEIEMKSQVVAIEDAPINDAAAWGAAAPADAIVKEESFTKITIKNGNLRFDDTVLGNDVKFVVVADRIERAYFSGSYDPKETSAPECFAIGMTEVGLSPHENSSDKQHDSCETCPMNQWGSGDGGEGKACKERRRLALAPPPGDRPLNGLEALIGMTLPPTNLKYFRKYKTTLNSIHQRQMFSVVTSFKVIEEGTWEVVEPSLAGGLSQENIAGVVKLIERSKEMLDQPYQPKEAGATKKPKSDDAPITGSRRKLNARA